MGTDFIHGTESVEIPYGERPIRIAKAEVIGLIGTSGVLPVNKCTIIHGTRRDAAEKTGEDRGDGFTIPVAMDAIYDQIGCTVIAINVCDPLVHFSKRKNTEFEFDVRGLGFTGDTYIRDVYLHPIAKLTTRFINNKVVFPFIIDNEDFITSVKSNDLSIEFKEGTDYEILIDAENKPILQIIEAGGITTGDVVLVEYAFEFKENIDFTVDKNEGKLQLISGTRLTPNCKCKVDVTYTDPSLVTMNDVIGGFDDGISTGVHAFEEAEAEIGVKPRILIAPFFSGFKPDRFTANPIIQELVPIARKLRAVIYANPLASNGDEMAVAYRHDYGTRRVIITYGHGERWFDEDSDDDDYQTIPHCAYRAGVACATMRERGWWESPSNKEIFGMIRCLPQMAHSTHDPSSRLNYLNSLEVNILSRSKGFRSYGNRTCSSDPKWAFESVVRSNDIIMDSIEYAHQWAIDRGITKNLFQDIVNSVNAFLRHLKNIEAILGGEAWIDTKINTPDQITQGHMYIDYDFTPIYPADRITFRVHMVDGYIKNLFEDFGAVGLIR